MSKQESSQPPPENEDRPKSLGDAFVRAFSNSARASVFIPGRNHVVARAFRKSLGKPLADLARDADAIKNVKFKAVFEEPAGEAFAEYSDEDLGRFTRNARNGYLMHAWMALVGAMIMVWGAVRDGFTGFSTMVGGMLIVVYAVIIALRAARDIHAMSTRTAIDIRRFLRDLDRQWCPLPKGTAGNVLVRFLLVPATVLVILAAPIVSLVS